MYYDLLEQFDLVLNDFFHVLYYHYLALNLPVPFPYH